MTTKCKGIILSTKEHKDADKVAEIFTIDYGIISVKFVSVKKEKAKFKNVCQPFVFCELEINEKNGYFTVINASILDSNFEISQNYEKNIVTYSMFEIILKTLPRQKQELQIFTIVLQYIEKIKSDDKPLAVFIDFIKAFLDEQGEGVQFIDASRSVYLDRNSGNFLSIPNEYSVKVDKKIYSTIKQPENMNNENILKTACKLLLLCLKIKYDIEIKSFLLL